MHPCGTQAPEYTDIRSYDVIIFYIKTIYDMIR